MTRIYDILKTPFIEEYSKQENTSHSNFGLFFNAKYIQNAIRHTQLFNKVADDNLFFATIGLLPDSVYTQFRDEFIDRFFTRDIKFQTVETFILRMNAQILANVDLINLSYSSEDKKNLVYGVTSSESTTKGETTSQDKSVNSDLPQNLQSWDSALEYASNGSEGRNSSQDTSTTTSKSYNAGDYKTLEEIAKVKENLFRTLDTKLFSQLF